MRFTPLLVLVAVLNALCYPLITMGLAHVPHLTFAALRAIVAGISLALIAAVLRRPWPPDFRAWVALGGIGFGSTTVAYFGMFHAAEFVSPGLATVVTNSQPLIAAILALVLLHEGLGRLQYLGLGLGFLGIVVVSLPQLGLAGAPGFPAGLAYVIIAAVGIAFGNVLMKAVSNRLDPLVAMAAQLLLGAVPLAVMALLFERPSETVLSPMFLLALLGLALPGTAMAYWLWFWLLGRVPLGRANAFTFLTPFIALAIGIAYFGEHASAPMIAGLALSLAGIVLVERGAIVVAPPDTEGQAPGP
ncbi:DMT family transporter [Aquibium carbonis]|jgi:drug/metabolite transporter (DMT)-like permease|uniref:DMT family transporter n=1 Tax=Aquibium carbonis TaxID=2495581 RepID=A0A3R9ZZK9_9HYPH|nr:DMT family transporter [Aquibium carbonis]RST85467.1 DMT family transporter [Aquibium carbonis]